MMTHPKYTEIVGRHHDGKQTWLNPGAAQEKRTSGFAGEQQSIRPRAGPSNGCQPGQLTPILDLGGPSFRPKAPFVFGTRYVAEPRRLLEVLNTRLAGRTYLVGETYTVADMATYPWARSYYWAKVSIEGLDHLQAWFDRIDARPATQRALEQPKPFPQFFGKGNVAAAEAANAARFKNT